MVPAARRATPGSAGARLLRVERHAGAVRGRPDHLQGLRDVELDVGPGRQGVLLAPLLLPPARPQLRQPRGRQGAASVVDFWLDMGVDGLRLDAVPYLFEREGTNCENLPETHGFLKELRAHIDAKFPDRMLLAEANQWPEDAVAYFGDGRRVPHGVPLPAHAAAVHGAPHGGPLPDRRHPGPDARHPRRLPVGHLPAQPRRADARDGDRRGARLHVPRLRRATRRRASTSASAAGWRRCWATTAARSS